MKSLMTLARATLIVVGLSLATFSVSAQDRKIKEKDVPPAVMAAFKSAYPNATIRGLAAEKENGKLFYEIESTDGTTKRDLLYNPDGTVAVIEETIAVTDLPAEAQQVIKSKYPKAVVSRAEKVIEGNKITYDISARHGKKRISLSFDADGKLLKK
jgi:hypothetical protein